MSLYEKIGGDQTISDAADIMYSRVVLDERLAPFFDSLDMDQQRQKFRAFLIFATGGPHQYSGLSLINAHTNVVNQGLTHKHVDAMLEHLTFAFDEIGVSHKITEQVVTLLSSFRNEVLGL